MPIPDGPSLHRSLLREDVFTRLRDAIVDGTFAPDEQLRDTDLAAWLGVSRTPVREALLRLADAGLVVARPGRSTVVSGIDQRVVQDARDVVAAMHETAVRTACPLMSDDDLAEMREANQRFAAAVVAGNVEAALAADDDLHSVPVRVAGNAAISTVLDQFTPTLRRAERLRFSTLVGRGSITRHDQLIRLCADGAVDEAAANAFDTWHSLDPRPEPQGI
ncbi:MAG: GntR family transcriptional regulator [Nocardioides sp.]|nr:GntR family transcriptional regulator [Nocardioides sp.]